MAIKKPIPISFNLDTHNSVQSVCAVIHIDDKNTETLDLSLMQGGEHIAVSHNSTVTARFVRVKNNTLISDDIACTVQENGNIHIPIDNAAAHMLVGEIKIEVNIVDESDVLTMQFPLVIRVNNTILADAEICPISKGTIPELIEKAQETADNAQETADNAQQTADNAQAAASTAQQTANSAQTAANSAQQTADNAIAGLGNKQDTLTAGDNITIENNVISAEGGGGAQIVSGVVNANGTITFTDSEGNSFTTSGSNLVTSGNEQVSVGYDEGGFYFLFDDGQEV